jgi:hypothetical protein
LKLSRPALLVVLLSLAAFAGVNVISGVAPAANVWFVNSFGTAKVVRGKSDAATYSCTATGLVTTAAYSMSLEAEAARGLRIQKICVGGSAATAAALQTITVQRRTTASSGGTAATSEGAASPAVSKFDPADGSFAGICRITGTVGTAGPVLDGWSQTVPEIGAGAADPHSQPVFCKTYGEESEKAPVIVSGVANGISVLVGAAGAGGLAAGSISIMFIAE